MHSPEDVKALLTTIDKKHTIRSRAGRHAISAMVAFAVIGTVACAETMNAGVEDRIPLPDEAGTTAPFVAPPEAGADADVDAMPEVALCIGTECPYPYADCPTTGAGSTSRGTYLCEVNLLTDSSNCGACGNVCPTISGLNAGAVCVDGECQLNCGRSAQAVNPRNCNGLVDDGCEIDIAVDPNNCGTCGNVCPNNPDGTQQVCIDGTCGCPFGQMYCAGPGCVDLNQDSKNCGTCGTACGTAPHASPKNVVWGCTRGTCDFACIPTWDDCDHLPDNGCETSLRTTTDCGACGNTCAAGKVCDGKACIDPCDTLNDAKNCGACGHACPAAPNAASSCNKGYCATTCLMGFADCDGRSDNGCEVDLRVDGRHCGTCGNTCDMGAGQPCIEGRCLTVECDGGPVIQ